MNRLKLYLWIALAALLIGGVALAQDALPDPVWNPALWFGSAAMLAAVVASAVAFLKANVLRNLSGWTTIAVSFGLAIATAVIGSRTSFYDATLGEAFMFGASAGLLASGGWDAIRGLLGRTSGPQ